MFWRRPALRAGRRLSTGPPPAEGGRRPRKIPPTRIQKLFASSWISFGSWAGMRRIRRSYFFDQVRVPAENLIGEECKGFFYLLVGAIRTIAGMEHL